jgi:hypothetical protein
VFTQAAARSLLERKPFELRVTSVRALIGNGWRPADIRAQVRAGRWQRIGRALILHNGGPSADELRRAALTVLGPRAILTAFSALTEWGLDGWDREAIHVLVPRGARVTRPRELLLRVHYTDRWDPAAMNQDRGLHRPAPAAVQAASTFSMPRAACGILAASVQQRLARPADLVAAVTTAPRVRHRASLLAAAHDIAGGAQALSEIDFTRLCRRARLPAPTRQAVRRDRAGRRRYLDAEWRLGDGRRVVAEVDGALHLVAKHWWEDQLRQNELVIGGDLVRRYPSVVVRAEEPIVVNQLARILLPQ